MLVTFSSLRQHISELTRMVRQWNEESDEWLEEHLMVKLLIGLALGAGMVVGIAWFIVVHTRPLDTFGLAYLLISSTIAYTWWAMLMFCVNRGYYDNDEEEEEEEDETE